MNRETLNKISKFMETYFFYKVDMEEKRAIRKKVIEDDHKAFSIIIVVIAVLQFIMLLKSFFDHGLYVDSKPWIIEYRLAYLILAIVCLIGYSLIKISYQNNKNLEYFIIVSVMMVIIQLWGATISILDSFESPNITTFAYVTMALPVFMILEPWITAIDLGTVTLLLNIHYIMKGNYSSGILINSLSVLILAVMSACFLFYRRIKKLKLELEIGELNLLLERKTIIDDLTKLYNRRYLTEHINTPLKIGERPTGVIMLDIDGFKKINDFYGHYAGDETLKQLGKILTDYMNDTDYVVRFGGEEFMVYIKEIDEENIMKKCEEIRKKMAECKIKLENGTSFNFTVSLGASLANGSITYSGLIEKADEALYMSKKTKNVSTLIKCE